jgi:hypothetical protein
MAYMHNGVLFSHKEQNFVCKKMNGTVDYHVEQDKPSSKDQTMKFSLIF